MKLLQRNLTQKQFLYFWGFLFSLFIVLKIQLKKKKKGRQLPGHWLRWYSCVSGWMEWPLYEGPAQQSPWGGDHCSQHRELPDHHRAEGGQPPPALPPAAWAASRTVRTASLFGDPREAVPRFRNLGGEGAKPGICIACTTSASVTQFEQGVDQMAFGDPFQLKLFLGS